MNKRGDAATGLAGLFRAAGNGAGEPGDFPVGGTAVTPCVILRGGRLSPCLSRRRLI